MNVLLVRLEYLGDVVLLLPTISGFRSAGLKVDLLTTHRYSGLFDGDERLRRCIALDRNETQHAIEDLGRTDYEAVLDFHSHPLGRMESAVLGSVRARRRLGYGSEDRPGFVTVTPRMRGEAALDCYQRLASLVSDAQGAGRLHIGPSRRKEAESLVPSPAVCLVPGARHPWRRWPAERFAALGSRLGERGLTPIIVGHPFDHETVAEVQRRLPGTGAILESDEQVLAAIFGRAGFVVANNSGLGHLASASGAAVVCVEGHLREGMWAPPFGPCTVVRGLQLRPCPCRRTSGDPTCPTTVTVEEVLRALLSLIDW